MRGDVLRCWVRERVRVRVDEAGKHGIGGKIGDRNAGGCRFGDGLDAVACDEDISVWAHGSGANVDELAGKHDLGDRGRLGLLSMQ